MKCVLVCRTLTSVFLVVVSRYTKQSDRDQVAVDGVRRRCILKAEFVAHYSNENDMLLI